MRTLRVTGQGEHQEKALLVGVRIGKDEPWEVEESLHELSELTRTAGAQVVGSVVQSRQAPDSATFIGRGKAGAIASTVEERGADLVVFDCELSPAQQRNLEELLQRKVVDRTQLILDIFAQRAETREGKIQVELAQLEYLMPRLTGRGVLMSRLGGGIGTRGPGETKLEVDRRRIRNRIARLKWDLDSIKRHRDVQRRRRTSREIPTVAIVGYTNAGKSSLLNALTDAHAFVEDKLFATLDPRSRRVKLPNEQVCVFTDTVGFVRKLPHSLIAAFRATLEEATRADVIALVVDSSHPYFEEHLKVAGNVLRDLDAADKPTITAYNKIDLLPDPSGVENLAGRTHRGVAISAATGKNIHVLLDMVADILSSRWEVIEVRIPQSRGDVAAMVSERGHVIERKYEDGNIILTAEVDRPTAARLRLFAKERP